MQKFKLTEDLTVEYYTGRFTGKKGTFRAGTEFIILKTPTSDFKCYLLETTDKYTARLKIRPNDFNRFFEVI